MNFLQTTLAASLTALALTGCSSTKEPKPVKEPASRPAQASFQAKSSPQVKAMLMSSCSKNRLDIKTELRAVECTTKDLSGARLRVVTNAVNDEFATDIREVIQFTLTEQNGDTQVVANIFARYLSPVSVLSGPETKKRFLLDDASFDMLQKVLDQAKESN